MSLDVSYCRADVGVVQRSFCTIGDVANDLKKEVHNVWLDNVDAQTHVGQLDKGGKTLSIQVLHSCGFVVENVEKILIDCGIGVFHDDSSGLSLDKGRR